MQFLNTRESVFVKHKFLSTNFIKLYLLNFLQNRMIYIRVQYIFVVSVNAITKDNGYLIMNKFYTIFMTKSCHGYNHSVDDLKNYTNLLKHGLLHLQIYGLTILHKTQNNVTDELV